ncbi:amidohydrolase family protein [Streptomyces sp. NPDC059897]|uniref:amidohydrolase family protein n=1 Tax=Streptomyces sp. NPDC059897 TaxID=3346994 RepID=UPI0036517C29
MTTLQEQDDEALFAAMAVRARQLLAVGVTTARDLGDRNGLAVRLAQDIEQGSAVGPRLVPATTPVTPPGGHCWFLGGEVSGPDEVRRLVRGNAESGARVIKVMATGGGLTKGGAASWESQFSEEELAALVDEAHRAGLPVAAHAHGADGIAAVGRDGDRGGQAVRGGRQHAVGEGELFSSPRTGLRPWPVAGCRPPDRRSTRGWAWAADPILVWQARRWQHRW